MKRVAPVMIFLVAVGCATLPTGLDVQTYDAVEGVVGQQVTLAGYWSAQHEATGIYFGRREYRDAPKQCVMVDPPLSAAHGEAVRVSGILEMSGCGGELICLTVCQPYVLKSAHLTP